MTRRLVTRQEILSLHYQGVHCLEIPPDAIITPGARDLIMALDFRIQRGSAPCAPAGDPAAASADAGACDRVEDQLRRLVEELAPQLTPEQREQVICAVRNQLSKQQ